MARKDVTAIVSGAGWIAGFADKLIRELRERGVSNEQIHSLVTDEGEVPVGKIADVLIAECFKPAFSRDMAKEENWTLLEDAREPWPISVANMELMPFLKEGENYVGGEEMVRRARKELNTNLGQRHAEFLLEHQNEIPEEFRQYVLVFTGTIWRDRDGDRGVPCLYWLSEQWYLDVDWLENGFSVDYRLPRPRE